MAFKIYSTDDNRVPGIEYLPASAITPKVGMALTQTTGQLALATDATAPTYISMCEKDGECTAGDIIPVIRVGKVKKYNGGANYWWERSPYGSNSAAFCIVRSNGDAAYTTASAANGVAFGFCF